MLGRMSSGNEVGPGSGAVGRDYGEVLWQPGPQQIERARITHYRRWLASAGAGPTTPPRDRGAVRPGDTGPAAYRELWEWSVAEPGAFWDSLWDYFDVLGDRGE